MGEGYIQRKSNEQDILRSLSPNIRRALYHKTADFQLKERIIFDYELLYLEKGRLRVSIEGKRYDLAEGDILLLKPGIRHSFRSVGSGENWMPHIHFDAVYHKDFEEVKINFKTYERCSEEEKRRIRPDVLGIKGLGLPDVIKIKDQLKILDSIKKIIHFSQMNDIRYTMAQKREMLKIIYDLMISTKGSKGVETKYKNELDEVLGYIRKNHDRKIKLETLAKICCLSPQYFGRLFKERYGVSTAQYIKRYRIEKAIDMMMYTKLSFTEISNRIGYSSIHSFSKAFHETEGISPTEYLKINK